MKTNPPVRNQHPEDVKAAVRKRGTTLTQVSIDAGLGKSTCRVALQKPIPAGNKAIASFLNKPINVLWPEWYDAEGARLPQKAASQ